MSSPGFRRFVGHLSVLWSEMVSAIPVNACRGSSEAVIPAPSRVRAIFRPLLPIWHRRGDFYLLFSEPQRE